MKAPPPGTSVVRIEIAPRSVALILATITAVWLLFQLWIVVLTLVVALIIAGTFNPVIEAMERRGLRRLTALILLFIALVLAASLMIFLTIPPMIEQLTDIVQHAPSYRERLLAWLDQRRMFSPLAHMVQSTEIEPTMIRVENYLIGFSTQALRVLGYGGTALVLSCYLLLDGARAQGVLYAVVPREYHMRLARILLKLEIIVGGYVRGQLLTSAVIGVFVFVLLLVCRVPNATSLALFAALVDVIPFIGGFLVIAPAVLSALPIGITTALIVLGALLLYMEFEGRILIPKVYGKVLRLSSTAVILALVAGGTLMGIMGALLALPITAGLLMILEELRVEMPGDDSLDSAERAKNARTESKYDELSAGASASEAGEIAKALAQEIRAAERLDASKP